MNKRLSVALPLVLSLLLAPLGSSGCQRIAYTKYEADFADVFDTASVVVGYTATQEEFNQYARIIHDRLVDLDHQYDIYNNYPGTNNLKTVNDNAGIAPVPVSRDILDLLQFGQEACAATGGAVNIALGAVLTIWHGYREAGIADPDSASLPPLADLRRAAGNTDINDLVIDRRAGTVFLRNKGMSLDVGSIAKGYATKLAAEAAEKAGLKSAILDIGGNVEVIGKPLDGVRERFGIGIQDPQKQVTAGGTDNVLDTVYVSGNCVVTSGDYQRYYTVDGVRYNHIIDPATLMPTAKYSAVTVICRDSGVADMLSTALYIMDMDQGRELLKKYHAEAVWIAHDDTMTATDGYRAISKALGGYSASD